MNFDCTIDYYLPRTLDHLNLIVDTFQHLYNHHRARKAIRIGEKPNDAGSNWAITGLYFFDNGVIRCAAEVKPSWRGELEITDVQNSYLGAGSLLHVEKMGRG